MEIIKDKNSTTYKGINVLVGGTPEYGTEWWTKEMWDEYYKQEERLKADGTWGTYQKVDLTLINNLSFDSPSLANQVTVQSSRFEIMDFSK